VSIYTSNEDSPVYSLAMEHGRIFAATERSLLMLDFTGLAPAEGKDVYRPKYYRHGAQLALEQLQR
jgi:hypothetical protein